MLVKSPDLYIAPDFIRTREIDFMKCYKMIAALSAFAITAAAFTFDASAEVKTTAEGITFDSDYYAAKNPEIAEAYGSDFDSMYRHYLEHGRYEGKYASLQDEQKSKGTATLTADDINSTPMETVNSGSLKIYVGDSRTYIMRYYLGADGATWLGYPGTGITTLQGAASKVIDGLPLEGRKIVILYGINDVSALGGQAAFDAYNNFFSTKAQEWIKRGATVYFANIIGVNNDFTISAPFATQATIDNINAQTAVFNSCLGSLPANIHRITLKVSGNPFSDGIHYNAATCSSIYDQINAQIN